MEYLVDEFFKNNQKHELRKFKETTPEGNVIKGYISTKPNKYLGSMVITSVNGEKTSQYVQSMPKLHYLKHEPELSTYDDRVHVYLKYDGSCIILYPLYDCEGNFLEIVPKTRGRAVCDSHFQNLYDKLDHKLINEYYNKRDRYDSLFFELCGVLNQHEIIDYDIGLQLKYIGCFNYLRYMFNDYPIFPEQSSHRLLNMCTIFKLDNGKWTITLSDNKFSSYYDFSSTTYDSLMEAYNDLSNILEKINQNYLEENGRLGLEGVILNIRTEYGLRWYKCKPDSILNKISEGIPKSTIRKEVYKYFDEYGSEVKEIYNNDKNHHTEYLYRMLSEEYSDELISSSRKKIERIFMQVWESREIPISIHNIINDLVSEYGDGGIVECMKVFGKEYPMKKKYSRMVYSVLENKLRK